MDFADKPARYLHVDPETASQLLKGGTELAVFAAQ
jgi:hypothetical protein